MNKLRSGLLIAVFVAMLVFVPRATATVFTVSIDFSTETPGSSYPDGWDGSSGCVPVGLSGSISGSATVGTGGGALSFPALIGDMDTWLPIHRSVTGDNTVEIGDFIATAGHGSGAINATNVFLLACDGATVLYEELFACSGHGSCFVDAANTVAIESPTDLYVYTTDCLCGAPGVLNTISISIDAETDPFEGGGVLEGPFKPVSGFDLVDLLAENSIAITRPNANIHAITGGQIVYVNKNALDRWSVGVLPEGSTDVADAITYSNLQNLNGELWDMVTAGCVLGMAAQTFNQEQDPASGELQLTAPEEILEDWPDYPDSPTDEPCDAAKFMTENCLNLNPNFALGADNWHQTFGVTWEAGAVVLAPGAAIYQDIPALDIETPYYLTLYASAPHVPAPTVLDVSIGGTDITLTIPSSANDQYAKVVSPAITLIEPDFDPELFRLAIQYPQSPANVTMPPIKIRFACLATTEATTAPGDCYFDDPDLTADNWTGTGATEYRSPASLSGTSGAYVIPAGEEIYRDVSISAFVDADTEFRLLTKTKAQSLVLGGRWHAWIRDPDTEDVIAEIGEWDILPVIVTVRVESFTLTEGTSAIGELVIKNVSDEISEDPGWTQEIYKACLQVEGGIWPGYDNADTGVIIPVDCELCFPPGDVGELSVESLLGWVVQWLGFGWCYLGYILKCLIYGLVNSVWQTILNFMAGFALFGKWVGMVVTAVAFWARDGFRFGFNGMIASLIPIANQVLSWLLNMPLVQTALDTLAIAGIWIGGLFALINNVISLILLGLQFIGALLNLIGVAWSAFLAALSAAPSTDFPFPDCTDSGSPLYHACIPLDVTNFLVTRIPTLLLLINVAVFSVFWRQLRKIIRAVREDIFETA